MDREHPRIETERLTLRPPAASDLDFLFAMNQDPEGMEFMPGLMSREDTRRRLDRMLRHFEDHGFGTWVIELAASGRPVGFAGLQNVEFEAAFVPAVEIAWRLAREHWGRGYASEAARALLRFGFETLDLREIVGFTVPGNQRSISVFQRVGMPRDPAFDFEHPKLAPGHRLRSHVFFRLARPSPLTAGAGA